VKTPTPEPCCPKRERIARAHGWTEASGNRADPRWQRVTSCRD